MMQAILFFLYFFLTLRAHAFPENVLHGYFTCTACHVSPSGGGVLTPYGRGLSVELLSTWGSTNTAGFFFTDPENEDKIPPWFRGQAFLRSIQTWRNTPTVEKAQYIPMQADLEVGVDTDKFAVVVTMGFRANDSSKNLKEFFSRRHFVLYRFDDTWTARLGKYLLPFGLNGPDHYTATRRGLNWDQGSESYNAELSYQSEKTLHSLTLVTNSPEENNLSKDRGVALNSSYFWNNNSRFGISLYRGQQAQWQRDVYGPYMILALTEKIYLDSELFLQNRTSRIGSDAKKGYATFHRLGIEVFQGLKPFIQFDRSNLDPTDSTQQLDTYGVGVQWLPYPHFDFMSYIGKEKQASNDPTDFAWLMMNIYL